MNEFSFGQVKLYSTLLAQVEKKRYLSFQDDHISLDGGGGDRDAEVIHIGEIEGPGTIRLKETRDVDEKEDRRSRTALRDASSNGLPGLSRTIKGEP